jgi:pantothenate kinase-related protein Tda10
MNRPENSIPEFNLESRLGSQDGGSKISKTRYQAFVIGICGGANSGKTFIVEDMISHMKKQGITVVTLKEVIFCLVTKEKFLQTNYPKI